MLPGETTARKRVFAATGLLALCLGGGGASSAASPEPVASEPRPILEGIIAKKAVAKVDEVHAEQAQFFGELFEKVDRIFGEHYLADRERKAQVRAGLATTFNDQGTSTDTNLKIGLRMPLPAMNRRLNAFVDLGGDVNELGDVSSPKFSASEKTYSLAAGFLHRYRDNLEAGIKLNLFRQSSSILSFQPFVRFEQRYEVTRYYFQERIVWDSDNTWSSLTDLDLDRRFRDSRMFLRLRNHVEYTFGEPGAAIAHGLIVRRGVFETSGLSYEGWLEYHTAGDGPTTIDDDMIVYAQLRLHGRIWRNWLEYELRPIYTVPINTDRKAYFGFLVSLTVVWDSYFGGDTPAGDSGR